MMANLKYEFVKLFTIRSTYVLSILGLALTVLFMSVSVWQSNNLQATEISQPFALMSDAPGLLALLTAVMAILIVGHEYRHNTIAYTLTASRSRASIMFSKAIILAGLSLTLSLLAIVVALISYEIAMYLRLDAFPSLNFNEDVWNAMFKNILYCIGLTLFAWLITMLVRSIVFAIVAFFMIPTIESMLSGLLKDNAAYLPATSLDQVIVTTSEPMVSPLKAGIIFSMYMIVGSVIAYILFVRRDAN